jgi:hypothetical protein
LEDIVAMPAAPRDGFLRIALSDLLSVRMIHLLSGVDEDDLHSWHHCGTPTLIMGYTEWVGEGKAGAISLGWDWRLEQHEWGELACVRVGLPRSNVMLVDAANCDYGWDRNLEMLASVVDAIPWSDQTQRAIQLG